MSLFGTSSRSQDYLCYVREMLSETIQYDPRFSKYTLQILSVKPQQYAAIYDIDITVSTSISPSLSVSYSLRPGDDVMKTFLIAFQEIEFLSEFEDILLNDPE